MIPKTPFRMPPLNEPRAAILAAMIGVIGPIVMTNLFVGKPDPDTAASATAVSTSLPTISVPTDAPTIFPTIASPTAISSFSFHVRVTDPDGINGVADARVRVYIHQATGEPDTNFTAADGVATFTIDGTFQASDATIIIQTDSYADHQESFNFQDGVFKAVTLSSIRKTFAIDPTVIPTSNPVYKVDTQKSLETSRVISDASKSYRVLQTYDNFVSIRSEPSADSAQINTLGANTIISCNKIVEGSVYEGTNRWIYCPALDGYIHSLLLEEVKEEQSTAPKERCKSGIVINVEELAIRDRPGFSSNIIGSITKGSRVDILCGDSVNLDDRVWVQVRTAQTNGWSSTRFLDISTP